MINMEATGRAIANARSRAGLTQERLAELVGVSVQAVSKWERGKNLPDIENLLLIAEHTNTPYGMLLGLEDQPQLPGNLRFRTRLFQEENMFTRLRTFALAEHLPETYKALAYMREHHMGQYRRKRRFSSELVQYINHPLIMTCQAHALGIRDDNLLAAYGVAEGQMQGGAVMNLFTGGTLTQNGVTEPFDYHTCLATFTSTYTEAGGLPSESGIRVLNPGRDNPLGTLVALQNNVRGGQRLIFADDYVQVYEDFYVRFHWQLSDIDGLLRQLEWSLR